MWTYLFSTVKVKYPYYEEGFSITAIKVEKMDKTFGIDIKVENGYENDFFDPDDDGNLNMEELAQVLVDVITEHLS